MQNTDGPNIKVLDTNPPSWGFLLSARNSKEKTKQPEEKASIFEFFAVRSSVVSGKSEKTLTLANRAHSFFKVFQMVMLEIGLLLIKGSVIQGFIKHLWKLIHAGSASVFYARLPFAFSLLLSQSLFTFYQKWRRNMIFTQDAKRLTWDLIESGAEIKSDEKAEMPRTMRDPSEGFYNLILRAATLTIEAAMYYVILGPMIYSSVIVLAMAAGYVESALVEKQREYETLAKDAAKSLTEDDSDDTTLRGIFRTIDLEYARKGWDQISKLFRSLFSETFTIGLMVASASLIFSGAYELALISVQLQAAREAFKSVEKYLKTPSELHSFQKSCKKLKKSYGGTERIAQIKDVPEYSHDKYIKNPLARFGIYALIIITALNAGNIMALGSQVLPLIYSVKLDAAAYLSLSGAYLFLCKYCDKTATKDVGASLVLIPSLCVAALATVIFSQTLMPSIVTGLASFDITLITILNTVAVSMLLFDHIAAGAALFVAHIASIFASQQITEILRFPASVIDKLCSTSLSGPKASEVPAKIPTSAVATPLSSPARPRRAAHIS